MRETRTSGSMSGVRRRSDGAERGTDEIAKAFGNSYSPSLWQPRLTPTLPAWAMNLPSSHPPNFLWFVVAFAAMWTGVAALLSRIGGWRELAESYPARPHPIVEVFRVASLGLGTGLFPVSYSNCLSVTI